MSCSAVYFKTNFLHSRHYLGSSHCLLDCLYFPYCGGWYASCWPWYRGCWGWYAPAYGSGWFTPGWATCGWGDCWRPSTLSTTFFAKVPGIAATLAAVFNPLPRRLAPVCIPCPTKLPTPLRTFSPVSATTLTAFPIKSKGLGRPGRKAPITLSASGPASMSARAISSSRLSSPLKVSKFPPLPGHNATLEQSTLCKKFKYAPGSSQVCPIHSLRGEFVHIPVFTLRHSTLH